MRCIYCGAEESRVIDSRSTEETNSIRRRRECNTCKRRFTTYETVETTPLMVIKSSGIREPFKVKKLRSGIMKACEKRPVSIHAIEELVTEVEKRVYQYEDEEISSKIIGEYVMEGLKKLDEVAYVRFASVYKKFKDIATFFEFVNEYEKILKS